MKRITLFWLVFCVTAFCCISAHNNEVILVQQLTQEERGLMPDKTIELQLPLLTFAPKTDDNFKVEMTKWLNKMADSDGEHRTFRLTLAPHEGQGTAIGVQSLDLLHHAEDWNACLGVLQVGGKYIAVIQTTANAALLKRTFKKAGEKRKFVREFEIVEFKRPETATTLIGAWDGQHIEVTSFVANDEDALL